MNRNSLKVVVIFFLLYNVKAGAELNTTTSEAEPAAVTVTPRSFSWLLKWPNFGDLLVAKKNIIAGFPLQIAAAVVDVLCSSTLFLHNVPQKVTPDIRRMNFHLVTPCRNFSVPLMEAEKLWQHMSFNKMRKVVILATGWTNTLNDSRTMGLLSKAFLCRNDVNFIIVDTASYVDTMYKWAALNTEEIGIHIAQGLTHLVKVVPLRNIHLIGHSLGAHIMGYAGRTFKNLTGQVIPRITGLDPAKPCFWKNETLAGLHRGDAEFIDVIHTNVGILAKAEPLGDVDFYPGGANALPPGCLTVSCAHSIGVKYFAESVYPGNENNFRGQLCGTWKDLKKLNCKSGTKSPMGYVVNGDKGIFYVPVNAKSPYGKAAKLDKAPWENSKCHICKKPIK